MEKKCSNIEVNTFIHNIESRFNSFKKKIEKLSKKNNITFDEDVFMDTVIHCSETFPSKNATNEDIDTYFWVAFKQNTFSTFTRDKFRNSVNLDNFADDIDIIDEEYNNDIDKIVDLIKNEVRNEFGDKIYEAWILHICRNYTYEELESNGYEGLNLHNEFRQIKRYITGKFIKKNKKIRVLLAENNII